jgi:hypothetical protein
MSHGRGDGTRLLATKGPLRQTVPDAIGTRRGTKTQDWKTLLCQHCLGEGAVWGGAGGFRGGVGR